MAKVKYEDLNQQEKEFVDAVKKNVYVDNWGNKDSKVVSCVMAARLIIGGLLTYFVGIPVAGSLVAPLFRQLTISPVVTKTMSIAASYVAGSIYAKADYARPFNWLLNKMPTAIANVINGLKNWAEDYQIYNKFMEFIVNPTVDGRYKFPTISSNSTNLFNVIKENGYKAPSQNAFNVMNEHLQVISDRATGTIDVLNPMTIIQPNKSFRVKNSEDVKAKAVKI
ncbi:MAG: hypothetical protein J0G32_06525 [Alphaproteobacteria bacterium]|nr:hypothetical protein [Alphaproteobacteria bacterium]OJV12077.1 MAG: hypothetical protein BGO27_04975 [Alphaproteobacteria bacterium 33-17]